MAKQSSVNLDITNNSNGFDISGGTTPRTLGISGGNVTIVGSGSATLTFPTTSDTLVGRATTDTLTNKTLTSPVISTITNNGGTITLPTTTGTLALLGANTYTGLQTFSAGITSTTLYASAGVTFNSTSAHTGLATFNAGITSTTLYASAGVTFNSTSAHTGLATFNAGISASGATFSGTVNHQDNTLSRVEFLDYFERYVDLGDFTNKGAQIAIDLSTAQVFRTKLTVACTGLTLSNIPDNANANAVGFSLLFVGDGTARTMTWNIGSAGISWAAGTAPTYTSTANKVDIYSFLSTNGGSNWYGFVGGQNF